MVQPQEGKGTPVLLPLATLLQKLRLHKRSAALIQVDRQFVADRPLAGGLTAVDLELDRRNGTQGAHALKAAALLRVACGLDVGGQAVGDET